MICSMCPRQCNTERSTTYSGYCKAPDQIKIARYSLHMWEEPCISGQNGSGTIFFSGCNLGCIYCQNSDIAHKDTGKIISKDQLVNIMLYLQKIGANNINFVTPSHYIHLLPNIIKQAKNKGLTIPIVYNSSGYESVEALKKLNGLIDIYLPDFKYMDIELARKYSNAPDYTDIAMKVIDEMVSQIGDFEFDDNTGLMKKGIIIRHLVLPGAVNNSKKAIDYLYNKYHDNVFISIMSQYTPPAHTLEYPELNRKTTKREYNKVVDYALDIGLQNAFIQEGDVASESFIPDFSDDFPMPGPNDLI